MEKRNRDFGYKSMGLDGRWMGIGQWLRGDSNKPGGDEGLKREGATKKKKGGYRGNEKLEAFLIRHPWS